MLLHHGHATLPAADRNTRCSARAIQLRAGVWISAWFACLIAACGDDGTEGLSSCPDGKIASDSKHVLHCASFVKPGAGRGGSTAKDGAAGNKAASMNTQASTGTSTPAQSMGAGNKPAESAGAPAAMSGQADKPASDKPAQPASGEAGKPAESSPPAGTPQPAAAGAKAAAANSGGGTPASVPAGPWSCVQYMDACSCVPHEGLGDGCTKPHPTCCTLVLMNGAAVGCVCVPPGSAQCDGMKADSANYPSVAKCPPN